MPPVLLPLPVKTDIIMNNIHVRKKRAGVTERRKEMKKTIALILSVLLVLTMSTGIVFADDTLIAPAATASTATFSDISGHWDESIISEAASLKIVGGYPEGDYKPDNLMKREEFFKLISNVLTTQPDISNVTLTCTDVDPIEWYIPTLKTAVAAGITAS